MRTVGESAMLRPGEVEGRRGGSEGQRFGRIGVPEGAREEK